MNSPQYFHRFNQARALFSAAVIFVLFGLSSVSGQDVRMYGIVKGKAFVQTNSGPAVSEGAAFQVFVSPTGEGVVTNAVLRAPGGAVTPLGGNDHDSEFVQFFPSTTELDAAYPNGIYTIELGTLHDGNTTNALNLTGDAYPATPHFSDFSGGQAVDPTAPFLLSWDPISGATSNDFLQVEISDCSDQRVIGTPSPGEPGALNATRTSFLLPARALRPGQRYEVVLQLGRFVSVNTNSYPGVRGIGGYLTRMRTSLVTTGTQTGCPVGRFELVFGYPNFTFGGSTQGMVNFPQGIPYYFALFNLQDDQGNTNFPSYVTFSGPVGSGLNNTTNFNGGFGGSSAWYSSPSLNTPPFPPGGVYTIHFGGTDFLFNLLDPNAGNQQVLLVPTAIINSLGLLTELRWTYKDTNGSTVGPQPFMAGIEIRIDGQNQRLYEAGNWDGKIPAATNVHVLNQPVLWTNVSSIQMLFRDDAGSSYGSFWNNSAAPLQIITSNLPPAVVDSPYFGTLMAFGGVQPHSWSIISGALPPGLTLIPNSGAISGTPTNVGNYNFTARVTDSAANHFERSYFIGVASSNSPPFISFISNQSTPEGVTTPPIPFMVGDAEASANSLHLSGNSSDQSIVRNMSIVFGGSGSNRTVTVTPEPNGIGDVIITLTVSDGMSTANSSFPLHIEGMSSPPATSPNIDSYIILKGQGFVQTNTASPVAPGPSNVVFRSWVSLKGETTITNVTLVLPNTSSLELPKHDHEFKFEDPFSSLGAMDAVYPSGLYTLLLATSNEGTRTNHLTLTGNNYPATPHLSNFTAAQSVNPSNDFTLLWDPIPGATTNDFIFISLADCHDNEVFSTPPPGGPETLEGTRTSLSIPGRTLHPGQTYKLEMLVARISDLNTNSVPGALGLAGYIKRLEAPLVTTGAPAGCPFGRMNFAFRFRPGGFAGTEGSTSYPQGIEQYQVNFSTENDSNAPQAITFSGPAGSGLNNTTNSFANTGGGQAWYASAAVDTPPFPPGGLYTVNYNGTPYPHHLLSPNAEAEQVLIVPNVIVDEGGLVTEVNWTYRDTNGAVIPAQAFMRQVRVQLSGPHGPLFPTGNMGHEISPVTTNQFVDSPVEWTNVAMVQMSFRDVAGHEFQSDWPRVAPSVQIATQTLPGGVLSNAYSFAVTAMGGNPPYSWSITDSGFLPPGLELDGDTGEIAGTPLAPGVFNFTIRVTDSHSQQVERPFRIRIGAGGPDVTTYLVAKGRRFLQTSAHPPAPAMPGYQFVSFVESEAPGRISSATLGLPGGLVRTLTNEFDEFKLQQSFTDQDALDAAFANGTYVFSIAAVNDGLQASSLLLSNNAYPLPPRVANWNAAQAVDAQAAFTLNWNPFSGGASNDFIVLSVMDNQGHEIFSTPGYLEPNFLNGTATSVVIPPNTLTPFATNKARLLFVKRTAFNTNSYPNVPGLAAYFAETYFAINTLNPAGVLEFSMANYSAEESAGTVEITVNRIGGSEGTVTVDYATGSGSATASDFVPTSGTLIFEPNVASQTFTLTLVDDATPESIETASLVLSNATAGAGLGRAFATLTIEDDDRPPGPSVQRYLVAKGQSFRQTGANLPSLAVEKPFRFVAFAEEAFPGALVTAHLRNPSAVTNELVQEGDNSSFEFNQIFTNKAALDAAYRTGAYTFLLDTLNEGLFTPAITLPADAYPSTPHLANWTAAQAINAFANFRLTWDPFVGGSVLDYIQISIEAVERHDEVFRSPGLGEAGALNGTNTAVSIPGGTFEPGQTYQVELLFVNRVGLNTDDYPDVEGLSAYFKETSFTITTATPPPPQGQIQFGAASQSVSETNGTATVTLMRAGGSEGAVSVLVTMTNGTATPGADYANTSQQVNFASGETNAIFAFELFDDSIYEGPESLRLFLSSPTGGATLAGQTNTVVILIDNELPPTPGSLQFSAATYTVAEAAGLLTVTVLRSGGSLGEVAVDYATASDSASSDTDYNEVAGTLVFPSGVNSRTFTIEINEDDLDETNEVLQVVLSNPANGATLGARTVARVTITDNDSAGLISFARATASASETNEMAEILVKRTGGLAEGVTVDYVTISGTATEGDDFETVNGTLTFEAGETEKVILVPLFDDAVPEGNETLSLVLSNVTGGATLGPLTNATLTIIDDEVVLQFGRSSYTNSEAAPLITLTVTRTGPTTDEVTVDYTTADETALAGEDYDETSGTITLAAGVASRSFTVPIVNDTEAEDDETFTVTLSNPSGNAQLGELDTATVLLLDNDEAGVIAFSATNFNVREAAPFALVTVIRSGGRASDITVDFEVLDGIGTADAESDYFTTNGTLTFGAGVSRLTFVVPIRDDATMEGNESIALRLSNPSGGATLGPRNEASVTILDNDVAGAFRFSGLTYRVTETGTVANVTVLRTGGKASARVDYATADGTATAGVDYVAASGTLLFGSNEIVKTFTVPILDDSLPDGNETVLLSLSNPDGGARLIAPTNAVLTIQDDELGVQFASATYRVVEGVRSVALTVLRAGVSTTAFTVHYATADETATAGSDYTMKSGTLTFGPGLTSQTIIIPIRNDTIVEDDETFTVILSNPGGAAQLGSRSVATVTIADNDASPLGARRAR